jgi:hypothetical protein
MIARRWKRPNSSTHDDAFPVVFGGDFNMRHSQERWDNFSRYQSLKLVHRICADPLAQCDVRLSWDGDAPWMDTQDLQFFIGRADPDRYLQYPHELARRLARAGAPQSGGA